MTWVVLVSLLGPFLISLVSTFIVRAVSRRIGFIDQPGGHKQHGRLVALGGGVAFFATISGALLLGTWIGKSYVAADVPSWFPVALVPHLPGIAAKFPSVLAILGCTLLLHIVGLIDDRKPLGPWFKLAIQVAMALVVAWPLGIRAVQFLPAPLSVLITVLWIVVITNAFNFLDNMDGLSAGVAAIAAGIFGLAAAGSGQVFVPMMCWVVVGSLVGFLCLNFSPASIFMGDAGSLVIGFLLGVVTILTTFYDPSKNLTPIGVFVPLLVLAVPLYDVTSVVIHRHRLGQSPFRGDRRHFSHRLVRRGMSDRGAVMTIYLATAATGLPAIVLPRLTDWTDATLLLIQCLCVVLIIAILEHAGMAWDKPQNLDP
ncbi:MAG: MraY family glycosyltransferase [Planctomycetota bacterium]